MGKRQRRRLREQEPGLPEQDTTPAVTVTAGLATATSSVPGPADSED